MKQLLYNKSLFIVIGVLVGLGVGWVIFRDGGKKESSSEKETIYTCSMHPQIRQNEPGSCPICGMDLVPVADAPATENGIVMGPEIIQMSEDAVKLANIQTSKISFTLPEKEIYLQGKIKVDERRVSNQTSHIPGRIEKLYISFTGEPVVAGRKLASIYSPELVTAQKELFEAIKSKDVSPMLYRAARNKLKQWKLNDAQIDAIEQSGKVREVLDIRAEISGIVLKRNVSVGDYVKEGSVLFTVVDLNKIWVEFDAYEADIPWLKVGDEVLFTVSSLPGKEFNEKITFIDPIINPQTRTASVRLELRNGEGKLKPEMFANGTITAKLPIDEAHLAVPKSAVMWTGKRSVVYVAVPDVSAPMFEFREITLGHDLGGYFIVEEGLKDGEMVVTNGTFKVDAAAQLAGKKSMMNKGGGQVAMGHNHGDNPMNSGSVDLAAGMEETKFLVSGECEMCKARIEKAALSIEGVEHAFWNKTTKELTAHFNENSTNKETIAKAIAEVGHDTEIEKSPTEIYNELPACCKYTREEEHKH